MGSQVESKEIDEIRREEPTRPLITAHELSDRYVFTETDNTDGWIASDLTVDPVP